MAYKSNEFNTLASQGSYISYKLAEEEIPLLKELSMEGGTINAYDNTSFLRDFKGDLVVVNGYYTIVSDTSLSTNIKIAVDSETGDPNDNFFQYLLARAICLRLGTGYSLETLLSILASWIIAYTNLGCLSHPDVDPILKDEAAKNDELKEYILSDECPYYETICKIAYNTMHEYFISSSLIGLWSLNIGQDLYSLLVTPSIN